MKNKYIIPIFVPHKGCPHQCIFCNQKKISGQMTELQAEEVDSIIKEYLEKNKEVSSENIEIAFYGGSFTAIEESKQLEFLAIAKKYIDEGRVNSIRLSTRPDYINEEILIYLKEYGVKTIELGVQSLNDDVLIESQRGHTAKDVENASKLINNFGFVLGHQMMVGLPKSNEEIEMETARKIVQMKPKIVRIYPVLVIKDTPLADEYMQKKYISCPLENAVEISAKLLQYFSNNDINVIRLGLQTTDNINEGKDVIAGPFHPAFGELVEQRIIRNELEKHFVDNNMVNKKIYIECNKKNVSKFVGMKKETIQYFKEKYIIDLMVKENASLQENEYCVKEELDEKNNNIRVLWI